MICGGHAGGLRAAPADAAARADLREAQHRRMHHVARHHPPRREHARAAAAARRHARRRFLQRESFLAQQHQHSDILIVEQARLARGQRADGAAIVHAQSRREVLHSEPGDETEIARGEPLGLAQPLRAGADDHVRVRFAMCGEQRRQFERIVLAVGIERDDRAVAVAAAHSGCRPASRPRRRADSAARAPRRRPLRRRRPVGIVARIVDDEHVARRVRAHASDHVGHGKSFIPRGNYGEDGQMGGGSRSTRGHGLRRIAHCPGGRKAVSMKEPARSTGPLSGFRAHFRCRYECEKSTAFPVPTARHGFVKIVT